jgi:hypothetical protein
MGSRTLEVEVSSINKLDILAVQTGDLHTHTHTHTHKRKINKK